MQQSDDSSSTEPKPQQFFLSTTRKTICIILVVLCVLAIAGLLAYNHTKIVSLVAQSNAWGIVGKWLAPGIVVLVGLLLIVLINSSHKRAREKARYESREVELILQRDGFRERCESIIRNAHVVFYSASPDDSFKISFISPRIWAWTGISDEQLYKKEKPWGDLIHPDDEGYVKAERLRCKDQQKPVVIKYRIHGNDGKYLLIHEQATWVEGSSVAPARVDGILTDITERTESERKIRQSEELFRTAFMTSPDLVCINRLRDGVFVDVNEGFVAHTGYTREEAIGRSIKALRIWNDTETIRQLTLRLCRDQIIPSFEATFRLKDGTFATGLMSARVIVLDGELHALSVTKNIENLKRIEEALRDSMEKYRSIFDTAANLIISVNRVGIIVECNKRSLDVLGYPPVELIGQSMTDIIHSDSISKAEECLEEAIEKGYAFDKEYQMIHKEGAAIDVQVNSSVLTDRSGDYFTTVYVIEDITERKRREEERRNLEAKMMQAQKWESLGVLAGGIAHDFNNLLMGVLGNADLALKHLSDETALRGSLRQIRAAAERAGRLTNQMLAYSGKGRFQILPLNLSRLVEGMTHLMEAAVSPNVTMKYEFSDDLPSTEGDPNQLRQVVVNLLTNASEAIGDDDGVVTVKTGLIEFDEARRSDVSLSDELPEGKYVFLKVIDDGSGMDEETMSRVFDPFFTTKFMGRGLGMAAVMGIVKTHHGAVEVESDPGKGTTLTVYLPAVNVDSQSGVLQEDEALDSGAHGTVLVIDDEEIVRETTEAILRHKGFRVLTAEDGKEGIELFRKLSDEIDVILLDMSMPHLSGEETFAQIGEISDKVKVILTSGYPERVAGEKLQVSKLAGFIQKPYRANDLISKIIEVLDMD